MKEKSQKKSHEKNAKTVDSQEKYSPNKMIQESIRCLVDQKSLTELQMKGSMQEIMEGSATHAQIASFLTGLRMKRETIEEVSIAAEIMREKAYSISLPKDMELFDVVGTGGDGSASFNISTACSLLLASGGVSVAKHGNRGVSSICGSADVLKALGVNITLDPKFQVESIRELGFGFLFAPLVHPAMKNVMGPRKEMGIRTIFNLLGPLTNPARPRFSLIGVYDRDWVEGIAYVLRNLGFRRAMVVHGEDGLDEISTTTRSCISELKDGEILSYSIDPKDYGIAYSTVESLKGGSPNENAQIIRDLLQGAGKEAEKQAEKQAKRNPKSMIRDKILAKRQALLLNAGVGFYIADFSPSISEGIKKARELLDSQKAIQKLDQVIEFSKRDNESMIKK